MSCSVRSVQPVDRAGSVIANMVPHSTLTAALTHTLHTLIVGTAQKRCTRELHALLTQHSACPLSLSCQAASVDLQQSIFSTVFWWNSSCRDYILRIICGFSSCLCLCCKLCLCLLQRFHKHKGSLYTALVQSRQICGAAKDIKFLPRVDRL